MKKYTVFLFAALMILAWTACGNSQTLFTEGKSSESDFSETFGVDLATVSSDVAASEAPSMQENFAVSASDASDLVEDAIETDSLESTLEQTQDNQETASPQISVTWGDAQVIYALNDSPAAASLLAQLPLTVEVEDYSTNEKIFYPPEALDTSDTPTAAGGAGTLAYYAPWGDVVMFYGDYSENPSLYALGQVVSGGELVEQMVGSITISVVE